MFVLVNSIRLQDKHIGKSNVADEQHQRSLLIFEVAYQMFPIQEQTIP